MEKTIKNNQLILNFQLPNLTKRQLIRLNDTLNNNLNNGLLYLESFKGNRQRHLDVRDSTLDLSTIDLFADYGNERIIRLLNSMFHYTNHATPKPLTRATDYVGVEIECLIPADRSGSGNYGDECTCDCGSNDDHAEDCELNIELPNETDATVYKRISNVLKKHNVKNVRIKDDGSLTENETSLGVEFICLTRLSDLSNLENLCNALKELEASIDSSCGLHIHLDARNEKHKAMVLRLKRALPLLCSMIPKSRTSNRFCESDVSRPGHRYAKINKESFAKHGTIEVRMHSGTTDFTKIKNWILICNSIAKTRVKTSTSFNVSNISSLSLTYKWNSELVDYIKMRVAKFKPNQKQTEFSNFEIQVEAELAA